MTVVGKFTEKQLNRCCHSFHGKYLEIEGGWDYIYFISNNAARVWLEYNEKFPKGGTVKAQGE